MTAFRCYIVAGLLWGLVPLCKAQNVFSETLGDLSKDSIQTQHTHSSHKGLLWFYKSFISSQQQENTCVFTESCSVYANNRIKQYGLIKGMMATADRLARCHELNSKYYHWDEETGKWIDAE